MDAALRPSDLTRDPTGRRAAGRCRSAYCTKAARPPSPWLLCLGAVAVGPELLISSAVWLVTLAVMPGVGAYACTAAGALLLVGLTASSCLDLAARVLLHARVATLAERRLLQPALTRLDAQGFTATQEVQVLVRRRCDSHTRPVTATRTGGTSGSLVLAVSADLAHAVAVAGGLSSTETAALLAHAVGRHEAAGQIAGRCALVHAAWSLPVRLLAAAAISITTPRRAALARHLMIVRGPVALLVLTQAISNGRHGPGWIVACIVAVSYLTPAARRRWQVHLEAGGDAMVDALDNEATPDAEGDDPTSTSAPARRAHLRLVPAETPR